MPDIRDPQAKATDNCWNVIGIRGDKSCDALAEHAHCRNCPTYAQIAATLLDRPSVDQWGGTQTIDLAHGRHNVSDAAQTILVFRLGEEWLGISIGALDEVVERRAIHSIPHRPNPVLLGIANVRGELVVCTSLDKLLDIDADTPSLALTPAQGRTQRLLILRSETGRLAVPVDEIQHSFSFLPDKLIAPPSTVALTSSTYTIGLVRWRDRTVAHLDAAKVISAFEGALG